MNFRIGQGLDVHAFCDGDHVMLGGVRIPHDKGLAAHSDGDVVIHALCDALLGAVAMGDIGKHFPPGDPEWAGASGVRLLGAVRELLAAGGWVMVNCDLTIACERPKIGPHVDAMRQCIGDTLESGTDAVSVKATTTERLGFCGREEGIAALAVVLVRNDSK